MGINVDDLLTVTMTFPLYNASLGRLYILENI